MAHELLENQDGLIEMAYLLSDGHPWHQLGQGVTDEDADKLDVWAQASNMGGFEFKTAPVLFYDEDTDEVHDFHRQHVAYRSDDKRPIATVGANYKIVQPRQVLEFFDTIIRDMGYKMTSAGILYGGRRFWAQAFTGQTHNVGGVDAVNSSVLLATGFDGSTMVTDTTTRVVCQNTLSMAHRNNNGTIKVPHSTSFDPEAVKEQMALDPQAFIEWSAVADALAGVKMTWEEAALFIGDALDIFESDEDLTDDERLELVAPSRTANAMLDLFNGAGMGAELVPAKGTLWGALNAVTEYVDHHRQTQTVDARIDNAWFGSQAKLKQRAWDLAMLKAA